jgi:ubiquinone/menaquinone biosynthesis C-methylase UbiE
MATVFMKWLETSPKDYDRGINILTLGRLRQLKAKIVTKYIHKGLRVFEIGCGTGTLTHMMAKAGAYVTAIDFSSAMMTEAQNKIDSADEEVAEHVTFELMDASQAEDHFSDNSFDLIVSTLVFSEMPIDLQKFLLASCARLLTPNGCLLIADEVIPDNFLLRFIYYLIRLPLMLITWLITRTSTRPLKEFRATLEDAGFDTKIADSSLLNSLVLFEASPHQLPSPITPYVIPSLKSQTSFRTLLLDIWTLFFRLIPPYPKMKPGLFAVGTPTSKSPVLVTGNFDLTVRRLVRAIDGRVDAWLLIADSAGINVWCAAGGGFFTAEKIISAIKYSRLEEVVDHHALILPQLCANGVDGWRIREETGWGVHWGPIRASDIPEYLDARRKKKDEIRWVRFPLKDRLEMVTVTMTFYGLMILLPVLIFWRQIFWPVTISLIGLSYFYAVVHQWLPGRDGLWKSIPLSIIAIAGLLTYLSLFANVANVNSFHWGIGIIALSVFTAAELQGMSPLMRGEQANWSIEALIFSVLGLIYWLIPLAMGWK